MGFKRPLVQIQSLGPNTQGYRKVPLFVCLGDLDRTPASSCNTINGRWFKSSHSDNKLSNGNRPENGVDGNDDRNKGKDKMNCGYSR